MYNYSGYAAVTFYFRRVNISRHPWSLLTYSDVARSLWKLSRLQPAVVPSDGVSSTRDVDLQGVPKKRIPNFIFRITSVIQHRF